MKTLRKVFGIVGTSAILLGLLLLFIGYTVDIGKALGDMGAMKAGAEGELAKRLGGAMAVQAIELVILLLGIAAAITF